METIFIEHANSKSQLKKNKPCVLALGFFDGVHLGHQKLIQTAKKIAEEKDATLAVMTFYPHPRQIVNKKKAPVKYLTPLHIKQEILRNMGVERLYVIKFDSDFALLSPDEFVNQYILQLGCIHVVTGFDYTYGYKGLGNTETLLQSGKDRFGVTVVNKISYNKEKISSTLIRELVQQGHLEQLPKYLGTYYKVYGIIYRSLLLNDGRQELIVKIDNDVLLPKDDHYQIQFTCNNLFYHGTIEKIIRGDNYSLLIVYIYEDFNLSVGNAVSIKWMKALGEENDILVKKENVFVG
ncbi:adenylyltransferase/cytidyltransferase family protein [Calidifontibacillus erzurumensis]|uniref:adenylyltransferase/cytidyltransferase family protein n=1 Tax=Calidifontibacillus erzurumensis TaxID=2741433 RepID=UPI0035B51954